MRGRVRDAHYRLTDLRWGGFKTNSDGGNERGGGFKTNSEAGNDQGGGLYSNYFPENYQLVKPVGYAGRVTSKIPARYAWNPASESGLQCPTCGTDGSPVTATCVASLYNDAYIMAPLCNNYVYNGVYILASIH